MAVFYQEDRHLCFIQFLKSPKFINILDGMFPYVREKQYFYMIFEESEKIV